MADSIVVRIDGVEQLEQRLQQFPLKLVRRGLANSLRSAGNVIEAAIQSLAPRLTGWLASNIAVRVRTYSDRSGIVIVGIKKLQDPQRLALKRKNVPAASHEASWAEFGTKNEAPKPFIRSGFTSSKDQALEAFFAKMEQAFKEEAAS